MLNLKIKKGKKPVKIGQEMDVKCVLKGKQGDGIAIIGDSNYMIIVKGGKQGNNYKVFIDKVCKNVAFALIKQ